MSKKPGNGASSVCKPTHSDTLRLEHHMKLCFSLAVFALAFMTVSEAAVVKRALAASATGENLLRDEAWRGFQAGFTREGSAFVCDNGAETSTQRGAAQTVRFNPPSSAPVVAEAWSKADDVGGAYDSDYALYLDLEYADGTKLWGQAVPFSPGTHDWERRRVVVLPTKPVKSVTVNLLLRNRSGRALFRDATLQRAAGGEKATVFDGVPVFLTTKLREAFQVRDVAAGSGFADFGANGDEQPFGLKIETKRESRAGASIVEATLTDTSGRDRAVTLVYSLPIEGEGWKWLADPRTAVETGTPNEYTVTSRCRMTAGGRLSRWPFAAIACGEKGRLIGIDAGWPAFYRCGFNSATRELFIAFDLGLAPEKSSARVRLVLTDFDGRAAFRGALASHYELFPEYFRCRTPKQGVWMPFYKISKVERWEDFGFQFKEGNDETAWDDAHGISTFRYTEPMTWWMNMPESMPRTQEAAEREARRLADKGDARAKSLFTSGFHDESGHLTARLLDRPWCNGAVWSMNDLPAIASEPSHWSLQWGPEVQEKFYAPMRKGELDGEYVDSSEGYVTSELDFRRDHFAAAKLPLTFSTESRRPAIFRGLIVGEYIREMAADMHARGKLMMANGTPSSLCWLAPWLDVMGTETDWHPPTERDVKRAEASSQIWRPMSDAEMLYRRALCGPKPYCFLMNTHLPAWSYELTEKFMKRCLAYGMFPGFFSADASTQHYFSQPALYNRDRPLFKKFVPLCRRVAEAGWQPLTKARTDQPHVHIERFGAGLLTVFNDSAEVRRVHITLEGLHAEKAREVISGKSLSIEGDKLQLSLPPEDVAVIELQ